MAKIEHAETIEKIKVMQGFLDGRLIEFRKKITDDKFQTYPKDFEPQWNWVGCDYRIKQFQPIEKTTISKKKKKVKNEKKI